MATLSRVQRSWLKDLGSLVGEAPAEVETKEEPAESRKGIRRGADDKALFGIPGLPELKPITSRITLKNRSNVALRVVPGSSTLENKTASFNKPPPVDIAAATEEDFLVTNDTPIGPVGGTGGEIKYDVAGDEKKVQLFMKWERGGLLPSRKTFQTLTPADGRFKLEGFNTGGDDFQFEFSNKGGTVPPPGPNPGPGPAPGPVANVPSSCQITVTNLTDLPLRRADADHERGDFMAAPPNSVPKLDTTTFVSVETPNAKEQGCKGFVVWEVGSPMIAVWRIEWDNPEGARNTSSATLTPQTTGLRSDDVIGQGEDNVPVTFTLSGGPSGSVVPPPPVPVPPPPPPVPVPPPPPPPGKDIPFEPPVEARQPTLRKGDKSPDGWVEYAQLLLNFHVGTNLPEDGDFGNATLAAVKKFQTKGKLLVDGVIGNQTWAALREGAPEKPSTDGRKPHEFVEEGVEARWVLESDGNNFYLSDEDVLRLAVQTVGDTPIDAATEATIRITAPGANPKVVKVKLELWKPTGVGFSHEIRLEALRKNFPSVPPNAPVTAYLVDAYLPQELGGDLYSGRVQT